MRRPQHWPYSLTELDLFSECSRSELRRIGPLFTSIRVDTGRVLMAEGYAASQFVVIADGTAEVGRTSDAGIERVAELGPGSVAGAVATAEAIPSTAVVRAVTPLDLLVCTRREFDTLVADAPAVADKIGARVREHAHAISGEGHGDAKAA
jgi:CRP-like cAMP-binding protein